ncbi:MAG: transcriptional repressor [Oscillospiraceae bacterium]|nr:transcriptional repressor [Oscillospiraceae bacterium]
MSEKNPYKTKQREELLRYLRTTGTEHVTVNDVCGHFRRCGSPIGTATVYRHLERMVDEGLVSKYIIDANTPACFSYIGSESHSGGGCFHCKCEKCGRLIHLHCGEWAELSEHILSEHGFAVNPMRTVFYGLCEACREAAE